MSSKINKDPDLDSLDNNLILFVSKKNKIHEEIKECVIDRFLNLISKQHKEIIQLKRKLELTIKNSLKIIKRSLQKKKLFPVKQIKLSYNKDTNKSNFEQNSENYENYNDNNTIINIPSLIKEKINKNNNKIIIKYFDNLKKNNLKKFINPRISLNNNKMNLNNKNNIYIKYNESLNGNMTYRNKTRNSYLYKDVTFFSDRQYDTIFSDRNTHKIEPINSYTIRRNYNINSLEQKENPKNLILLKEYNNNHIQSKKFIIDENCENEKSKMVNIHNSKGSNKIRLLNKKTNNVNNINNIKRNTAKNLNSFKKLNLSYFVMRNNQSLSNNINDYLSIDNKNKYKDGEKQKNNCLDKNKLLSYTNKNKYVSQKNININKSLKTTKKCGINKLNNLIIRMSEAKKNIYLEMQNFQHKTEKRKKKLNINDINKINIPNIIPMTDKYININKSSNGYKNNEKGKNIKNIKYYFENKKNYSNNINEINYNIEKVNNSFRTIYNPTFTSFLNRKIIEKNDGNN